MSPLAAPSSLTTLATYRLTPTLSLIVAKGSVVDYDGGKKAAIVNAANAGCLGGGGVDGAISTAGGPNLARDRLALPIMNVPNNSNSNNNNNNNDGSRPIRCQPGHAVVTGPGEYGSLGVPYVIHAVGPNYWEYEESSQDDNDNSSNATSSTASISSDNSDSSSNTPKSLDHVHALLQSAYQSSLDLALELGLHSIAFSLLSAGVYRGSQSLNQVLTLAVAGIQEWSSENKKKKNHDNGTTTPETKMPLSEIVLCAFTAEECKTLQDVCDELLQVQQTQTSDECGTNKRPREEETA